MRTITFLLLLIYTNSVNAQKGVKDGSGIIIQIDSVDVNLSLTNMSRIGYKYLFNIFHLKVVTAQKDTLVMGLVYNINKDVDSLSTFKSMIGKPFIITTSEFAPLQSDFPKMANCNYETGLYNPARNSFLYNNPYKSIQRLIDFVPMDPDLWQELLKHYN